MPPAELRRILDMRPIVWLGDMRASSAWPELLAALRALAGVGLIAGLVDELAVAPQLRDLDDGEDGPRCWSTVDAALLDALARRPVLLLPGATASPGFAACCVEIQARTGAGERWLALLDGGAMARLEQVDDGGVRLVEHMGHVRLLSLADPTVLSDWLRALLPTAAVVGDALELRVDVLGERWLLWLDGWVREVEAPVVDDPVLRELTERMHRSLACDEHGRVEAADAGEAARAWELATLVGDRLLALLPARGHAALRRLIAGGGGRLQLRLTAGRRGGDDEAALGLPWELLRIDGRFPVADGTLELLREVESGERAGGELPPLSVVSLVAAPSRADLDQILLRQLRALAPLRGRIRRADFGSLQALQGAVDVAHPALVHIAGAAEDGRLLLEARYGEADPISAQDLARTLTGHGSAPALWLSCVARSLGPGSAAVLLAALQRFGLDEVFGVIAAVPGRLLAAIDGAMAARLAETGSAHAAIAAARAVAAAGFVTDRRRVLPLGWALPQHLRRGPAGPLARVAPLHGSASVAVARIEREPFGLAGIGQLPRGFVGRRRLLQQLEQARLEAGEQALVVHGPPGSGRTATLLRLAVLLLGRGVLAQRVIGVRVAARDFAGLRRAVAEAVAEHSMCPDDWASQLATVDADDDPGAALARALLAVGRGRKAWIVDAIDELQRPVSTDERGAETGAQEGQRGERGERAEWAEWADDPSARFFATLLSEVPKGATVLLAARRPVRAMPGKWFALPPYSRAELLEIATCHDLDRDGADLDAAVEAAGGHPGRLLERSV